jgi:hypothetical protein
MTEHDVTRPSWGRNVNITKWDSESGTGRAASWLTPPAKVGDVVIVKSQRGFMRLSVTAVEYVFGVDDMQFLALAREAVPADTTGEQA